MKISTETSIYIALTVINQFEITLKGKKYELLKELTSNEVKLLDEIKYNCIITSNLPASSALSTLIGGITKTIKTQVGNLTQNENIILMRLVKDNFYVALRLAIDEQCKDLEI